MPKPPARTPNAKITRPHKNTTERRPRVGRNQANVRTDDHAEGFVRAPRRQGNFRRRPRRSIAPLFIAPAIVALAVALGIWALCAPQLDVKRVAVYGAETVSPAQIASLVPLPAHRNLFVYWAAHHRAISAEVERGEPAVERARVGIRPPGTLTVTIYEREPYALLHEGQSYWEMDREGVPFRLVTAIPDGVPIVSLPEGSAPPVLGQAYSLAQAAPVGASYELISLLASGKIATLMKIREITVDQNANLCLNMTNNLQIRLGQPSQLEQKLALAATALESDATLAQRAAYLDFTDPDRPAWKPRSADVASSPPAQNKAD